VTAEASPPNYSYLHTAEDIAVFRQRIMAWSESVAELARQGDPSALDYRQAAARMAAGVTARAVELGLEQP
jgi:hypothetical protein